VSAESPSDLTGRLRRLRREPERARKPVPRDPSGLPVWMTKKLAARDRRRSGSAAPLAEAGPDPGDIQVGAPTALEEVHSEGGVFAVRETRFPAEHVHGAWALGEVTHAAPADFALLARDVALTGLDLDRAVYLDVETTGLSGGAGTISFLVALGTFDAAGFTLWQGFLRGPEEEAAMLAEVARRVAAADALVSFFGKSFDRHRLEDKMRLHGVTPPFEERPHLDLYHPLTRLYRAALPDGRLQTMERALCSVARTDDLPGSFAPEAWFDFLGERAHRLEDVFRHNADDVLSLVTLAAHLGRTTAERRADGEPLSGPGWARAKALARLFAERREPADALAWLDRAEERLTEESRELAFLRASCWKRVGREREALTLFEGLGEGARDGLSVRAWIEAAKLAEHALRDAERARSATAHAQELLSVAVSGAPRVRLERELEHRARRLASR